MTACTSTRIPQAPARTAVDFEDIEMTLTREEWHLHRDSDDAWVVVPHESQLVLAA